MGEVAVDTDVDVDEDSNDRFDNDIGWVYRYCIGVVAVSHDFVGYVKDCIVSFVVTFLYCFYCIS